MSDNTLENLNKLWVPYKTELETEWNRNSMSFGDLAPGNIYHLPVICNYQSPTDIEKQPWAGNIKDLILKQENASSDLKLKRVIGYYAGSRFSTNDSDTFKNSMRFLIKEIELTIKNNVFLSYNEPHYGYYVKFSDFTEVDDIGGFQIEVESNVIPMVQLNRIPNDIYAR